MVQDSILKLDIQLVELQISNEEQIELGPLKYISELTGKSMDKVVNWFLLLIIFVFDPLAIAMIVAMNFAFSRNANSTKLIITNKSQEKDNFSKVPEELTEEQKNHLSTIIGSKEKDIKEPPPIKPTEKDLKKLEETLGLNKKKGDEKENSQLSQTPSKSGAEEEGKAESVKATIPTSPEDIDKHKKKILKYKKRSGNDGPA